MMLYVFLRGCLEAKMLSVIEVSLSAEVELSMDKIEL